MKKKKNVDPVKVRMVSVLKFKPCMLVKSLLKGRYMFGSYSKQILTLKLTW